MAAVRWGWAILAGFAIRASLRPTRIEYLTKVEPEIEWPRVAMVWGIVAAELVAFAWLVTRLRRTGSWTERVALCSLALLGVVAAVIDAPNHGHGPAESAIPSLLGLLLSVLLFGVSPSVHWCAASARLHDGLAPTQTNDAQSRHRPFNEMISSIVLRISAGVLAAAGFPLLFASDVLLPRVVPDLPAHAAWLGQLLAAAWLSVAFYNWNTRDTMLGGIYGRPAVLLNFGVFFISALTLLKADEALPLVRLADAPPNPSLSSVHRSTRERDLP